MRKIFALLLIMLLMLTPTALARHKKVPKPQDLPIEELQPTAFGIDRVGEVEVDALFEGKRVGVFTNQSGINSKLENSVDVLLEKYNVVSIFTPEHGLMGAVAAGEEFSDEKYRDVTVFSLYGSTRRPTEAMLDTIDVMAVDIQDVGVRHYTYTSSLAYIMEECAKYGKKVVVFDRPNPLGGAMEGPVLKPEFSSFIGLYEMPLRHGLTIGEFARFINTEKNINCPLEVVAMKNWRRDMLWADTKLPWVQTSPLIPTAETAILYNVTGICGDANISIGVGTAKPFYYVGTPFADTELLKKKLEEFHFEGVGFRKAVFVPRYGGYSGKAVQALEIYILEPKKVNLSELGYAIAYTFRELYPEQMGTWRQRAGGLGNVIDIAQGEDSLVKHEAPDTAFARWREECAAFKLKATPYLLY